MLKNHFAAHFTKYLKLYSPVTVDWVFPNEEFKHAFLSGHGEKQVKVIDTVFKVDKKEISVVFKEDKEGSIIVNGRLIYSVKPTEEMGGNLLKTLAYSIRDEI